MAKRSSFVTRARKTGATVRKARRRATGGPTFIQRSRGESSEQKAMFHQVTGAGRSRVKRPFLGLLPDEQEAQKVALEGLIAKRLKAASR